MNEQLDYEALCTSLYAYRFGAIGFLELLEQFEQILHISSDQTELMNFNSHLRCKGERNAHRCTCMQTE